MTVATKFSLLTLISLLLIGCGGGGSDSSETTFDGNNDTNDQSNPSSGYDYSSPLNTSSSEGRTTINSLTITGTSAKDTNGRAPINPAENNGKWSIEFETTLVSNTNDPSQYGYDASLVLTSNKNGFYDGSYGFVMYNMYCNGRECLGKTKVTLSCTYENNNPISTPPCVISSASGENGITKSSIKVDPGQRGETSNFFDSIPANGFILLQVQSIEGPAIVDRDNEAGVMKPVVFE